MKKALHAVLACALLTLSACQKTPQEQSVTAQLRILETTDLHANVMDFNYYSGREDITIGLARTAAVIAAARSEVKNSVLVDNGDLIQGSAMGDFVAAEFKRGNRFTIHPTHKAMNKLDYAVGNIGNHEFNYGLNFLHRAIRGAAFPYISANVLCKADCWDNKQPGEPLFPPYLIRPTNIIDDSGNPQQLNIGYIGFVPPQIMVWDKRNLEGRVSVIGIVEAAEKYVPQMKQQGADIIIAIPHSGVGSAENPTHPNKENASYALTRVEGIDAIMFGHSHSVFPSQNFAGKRYAAMNMDLENGSLNGVPAVMPGRWGDNMGQVDLQLQRKDGNWSVVAASARARPIYIRDRQGNPKPSQEVVSQPQIIEQVHRAVAEDHQGTLNYINAPIGYSEQDMYSFLALVQDDPTVQIVADAQRHYIRDRLPTPLQHLPLLSAAAPFKAGGRHNASDSDAWVQVPAGNLSYKNASDLYLYPNTVVALRVNGAQVKEWLECSANQFNQIDPNSAAPQSLINWQSHATYNFDVIDGINYRIDVTQPNRYDGNCQLVNSSANRITDLSFRDEKGNLIQGEAFANMTFIVVTNNYRAFGGKFAGTGAKHVVVELPDLNRDALSAYITAETEAKGRVNPAADNNWDFKTITSEQPLDIRFESQNSTIAGQFIRNNQRRTITRAGEQTDAMGFAVYQIDLQN